MIFSIYRTITRDQNLARLISTRVLLYQASKPPSKPKKKMVYFVKISSVVLDKDNISRMVRS
jgi:hypothetical protein